MSWTRGTHERSKSGRGGRRERAKQSARNETKPPPTAAAAAATTAAAAASQNLNDKRARTTGQKRREEARWGDCGTEGQRDRQHTDGNFLHTNSVTDKQRERGKESKRGRGTTAANPTKYRNHKSATELRVIIKANDKTHTHTQRKAQTKFQTEAATRQRRQMSELSKS